MRRGVPFSISILALMLCIVGLLSAALLAVGWRSTKVLEASNVALRMKALDQGVSNWLLGEVRSNVAVQLALGRTPAFSRSDLRIDDRELAREFAALLGAQSEIAAAFVGYADGRFVYVGRAELLSDLLRREMEAPAGAILFSRTIDPGQPETETIRFVQPDGSWSAERRRPTNFDPRARPWYREALAARGAVMTEPYAFALTGTRGVSVGTPIEGGRGVIAFDYTLAGLSRVAARYRPTDGALVIVATAAGNLLADSTRCASCAPGPSAIGEHLRQELSSAIGRGATSVASRQAVDGVEWEIMIDPTPPVFGERFLVAAAVPTAELSAQSRLLIVEAAGIALLVVNVAVIAVLVVAFRLSGAIRRIAERTGAIRELRFAEGQTVRSRIREVIVLAEALDRMRDGLQIFGRYVAKDLVRQIMRSPDAAGVGGERRELTVMFTDIEGFSRLSEDIAPELLTDRLSRYFDALAVPIAEHRGTIDKFIGDGIMAFWNAPEFDERHVENACRAALDAAVASRLLAKKWRGRGRPVFRTRFGLHTGPAVIGNVGARERVNYTLVGAVANLASRLEALNKVYGTEILASGVVAEKTRERFVWRHMDSVVPAGTSEVLELFEPLAPADEAGALEPFLEAWRAARAHYVAGDFDKAHSMFGVALGLRSDDNACRAFIERCRGLGEAGRPADWDGVWRFDAK